MIKDLWPQVFMLFHVLKSLEKLLFSPHTDEYSGPKLESHFYNIELGRLLLNDRQLYEGTVRKHTSTLLKTENKDA